jgi:mRNA interferase RelE/StbE
MWRVEYLKEAVEDLKRLDHSQRLQVLKAIDKVSTNPLPQNEGGYGNLLETRTA